MDPKARRTDTRTKMVKVTTKNETQNKGETRHAKGYTIHLDGLITGNFPLLAHKKKKRISRRVLESAP